MPASPEFDIHVLFFPNFRFHIAGSQTLGLKVCCEDSRKYFTLIAATSK